MTPPQSSSSSSSSKSLPAISSVAADSSTAAQVESGYVHSVYDAIASHFSGTRHKPWPVVQRFLEERPAGDVGVDVGCGNGKYLSVNRNVLLIGTDRSEPLIRICHERKCPDSLVADGLRQPFATGRFDFAISIAVIHHMASAERRLAAVQELLRLVRPGGQVLIFVWALEQTWSKSSALKHFKEYHHQAEGQEQAEAHEQDVFVPWRMPVKRDDQQQEHQEFQRYYHLFRRGELDELVTAAGGRVLESSYDRDNWYVVAQVVCD
ncbi:tRNA methyltransferase, has a role in tRNA modification [Sorochytrium milnesiophthora]